MSVGGLAKRISETGSHHAVSLLQHIKRVAVSRRAYLPQQMQEELMDGQARTAARRHEPVCPARPGTIPAERDGEEKACHASLGPTRQGA